MGSHDKLFKAVFSDPSNAIAHFEGFLPVEIASALDLSEAVHEPGSFVDVALKERHTDLLYRIPWRQKSDGPHQESDGPHRGVLLFVIFEHQSSIDSLMPYRMLTYAVRVWARWLQEQPEQKLLPPILPLVLYHGDQEWTAATELRELFDVKGVASTAQNALRPFLPKLQILLHEVAKIPDEQIPGQGVVRLTLLLFKHAQLQDVLDRLPQWEEEFRREVSRGAPGLRNVALLVEYLFRVNKQVTVEALVDFLTPMGDDAKEIPMTLGEQLIEQGRQEGRQEGEAVGLQKGRREEKLEVARKALAKGMSPPDVAELTDLTIEEVHNLAH